MKTSQPAAPDYSKFPSHPIKAEVGETVRCRVSKWHSIGSGTGRGFAFILPEYERRGSLYLREDDVITAGTIQQGSLILCEVAPPSGINRCFEGKNIQIYQY
jgi:hypothetical protein